MISALNKGCNANAKQDDYLKQINIDEYCHCYSKEMIGSMTDIELKQALLAGDKKLMQNKMNIAASLCMSSNIGTAAFVKKAAYDNCIEKPSANESVLNKQAYCSCSADKLSQNLSQKDMQDFIEIGQKKKNITETSVSGKLMSVAAECINQNTK